jgi:Zn-dependent peptidase ImmA (M78 family)
MYPDEMHIPTYPEGFPVSLPEDHKAAVASDAAEALRRAWMLGSAAPAPFLADLLEGIGIRVGFIPGVLTFDAAAFIAVDGETSIPCIVAQSTMAQGDLQRFAIARELAFLLLEDVSRAEANHFAGALLLPEAALVEDFGGQRHNIEMMELYMTKQKYGISIRHILSRLASLRIISGDLYKELLDFYNDAGWNDVEPGMQVPPEQPYRLYRRVMRGQLDGDITLGTGAALAGLTLPDWMNFLSIGELAAAISPR